MAETQEHHTSPTTRVKDTTGKVNSIVIIVSGAGMFSAISLLVSLLTTELIPRFGWGLAWFDPVSVIWILSFFVFGYEAGIITSDTPCGVRLSSKIVVVIFVVVVIRKRIHVAERVVTRLASYARYTALVKVLPGQLLGRIHLVFFCKC